MTVSSVKHDLTQDKHSIHHYGSLGAVFIVLILFFIQILIAPLTFSSWWHCPMMDNHTATTISMNMDDCMHMNRMDNVTVESHTPLSKQHPMKHGGMNCPLCISYTLPTPLLTYTPDIPNVTITLLSYVHAAYYAHAPPAIIINANRSRAPPIF